MTATTSLAAPVAARRWTLRALISAFRPRRKPYLPPGLDRAQLKDAGIAWELAGYGRGADVPMLAITILESQR